MNRLTMYYIQYSNLLWTYCNIYIWANGFLFIKKYYLAFLYATSAVSDNLTQFNPLSYSSYIYEMRKCTFSPYI